MLHSISYSIKAHIIKITFRTSFYQNAIESTSFFYRGILTSMGKFHWLVIVLDLPYCSTSSAVKEKKPTSMNLHITSIPIDLDPKRPKTGKMIWSSVSRSTPSLPSVLLLVCMLWDKGGQRLTIIGLFQMLGGFKVAARHPSIGHPSRENKMNSEFMDDSFLAPSSPKLGHSDDSILPFSVSSPKCSQLYNIFYSSDPISYRIEPLIAPAMASLKPQPLPYTKKGIFSTSASQGLTGIGTKMGQSVSGLFSSLGSGIASSLLNRSLGLSGEEIASMNAPQTAIQRSSPPSPGAGTNISSGGVITAPSLARSETAEKKRQLAEDAANADREGNSDRAPTLIDSKQYVRGVSSIQGWFISRHLVSESVYFL